MEFMPLSGTSTLFRVRTEVMVEAAGTFFRPRLRSSPAMRLPPHCG